jgi:hypothetical protein
VRPPREPQAWVASMVVADDNDVTVGLDADRDPDTEESSLVLHRNNDARLIAVTSKGPHKAACAKVSLGLRLIQSLWIRLIVCCCLPTSPIKVSSSLVSLSNRSRWN